MSIADLRAIAPRGWSVTSKGFGEYAISRPGTTEHKAKGLVYVGTVIKEYNGYIVYGTGSPTRVKSEAGVFSHLKKKTNPRCRRNPIYDETLPEAGWAQEEWNDAMRLAHKRAKAVRARSAEQDKVLRISRWTHTGRTFPVRVIAEKKVGGVQIQLGRHNDPYDAWYAIRIPAIATGWFWATRTRSAAKASYRGLTNKAKVEAWSTRPEESAMKSNPNRRRRHSRVTDLLTAREHAQAVGTVKKALAYCGIKATVRGTGGVASDRGIKIDVAGRHYPAFLYPSMGKAKFRSLRGYHDGPNTVVWSATLGDEWASDIEDIQAVHDVGTAAARLACYMIESYIIPEGDGRWPELRSTKRK